MSLLSDQFHELIKLLEKFQEYLNEFNYDDDLINNLINKIINKKEDIVKYTRISQSHISELRSIIEVLKLYRNLSIKATESEDIINILKELSLHSMKISFCKGNIIFFFNKDKYQLKKVFSKGIKQPEQKIIKNLLLKQDLSFRKSNLQYFLIPYIEEENKMKEQSLIFTPLIANEEIFAISVLKTDRSPSHFFDNTLGIIQNMADLVSLEIQQRHLLKKNELLSISDVLTGLYNSRHLDTLLKDIDDKSKDLPVSLIFIDLDGFKSINDNHGHKMGSSALKEISQIINTFQINGKGFRYGGDEFVLLLLSTNTDKAFETAESIRKKLENTILLKDYDIDAKVTASIGISTFPTLSPNSRKLFSDADNMMYMAKKAGKNRICIKENNNTG